MLCKAKQKQNTAKNVYKFFKEDAQDNHEEDLNAVSEANASIPLLGTNTELASILTPAID